jgi:hypothetical protein
MIGKTLLYIGLISLIISNCVFSQYVLDKRAVNPFSSFKYDSVVLYKINKDLFLSNPKQKFDIVKGDISDTSYIDYNLVIEHKTLSFNQDSIFSSIIADTNSYGGAKTSFVPDFQVVYYLKGHIVGWILLDFDANVLSSSFYISPKNYFNKIYEGEDWVSPNDGFSRDGRKKLIDLFEMIGFKEINNEKSSIHDD